MKILMIDSDSDNRLFALLAFKELNLSHSIDFVFNDLELSDYLLKKLNSNSQLPDLVLINMNQNKTDRLNSIKRIKSNTQLKQLKTITFSTVNSIINSSIELSNVNTTTYESYNELNWIFKEIRDELNETPGWEYLIDRSKSKVKVEAF